VAQAKRWDVLVFGAANTDYLVKASRLPRAGEMVPGDVFLEAPGGKGANQAVAAARLGARTAFAGRVGDDHRGEVILEALRREGVDTTHVQQDPSAPSGVALITVDATGERQVATAPGANGRVMLQDVAALTDELRATRVLLVQLEVSQDAVARAIELAARAGARVVLDPAPAGAVPDEALALVDVVRPNAIEAGAMTGICVRDRDSAERAARELLRRGARSAVVAAPGGNLLLAPDTEMWVPKLAVKAVDSTGADDAFTAALAVCLAEERPLDQAVVFASAAAAFATTRIGAQAALPRRQEVERLMATASPGRSPSE